MSSKIDKATTKEGIKNDELVTKSFLKKELFTVRQEMKEQGKGLQDQINTLRQESKDQTKEILEAISAIYKTEKEDNYTQLMTGVEWKMDQARAYFVDGLKFQDDRISNVEDRLAILEKSS